MPLIRIDAIEGRSKERVARASTEMKHCGAMARDATQADAGDALPPT